MNKEGKHFLPLTQSMQARGGLSLQSQHRACIPTLRCLQSYSHSVPRLALHCLQPTGHLLLTPRFP